MAIDERMADRVVELMNEALDLDPEWVTRLVLRRELCNRALADHPTIQSRVLAPCGTRPEEYEAGVMGLLNGLCGVFDDGERAGYGAVAFDIDLEAPTVLRFRRVDWRD